jgi:hypothetical protein
MAKKPSHRQAISILKHLPAYSMLWGWKRSDLARALLSWFIAPDPDNDSRKARNRRSFVASWRLDELSRDVTPFYNLPPFSNGMIQMICCFDRLIEYSVQMSISPFDDLPKKINGLTVGMWGNWCGAMRWPSPNIQSALDNFFIANLGSRYHVFQTYSDQMLLSLGYLSDKHLEHRNSWRGDRNLPGGDETLRLTSMVASMPMFAYTKKSVRWDWKDRPSYVLEIKPSKDEHLKKLSREQRYIRRSYYWGKQRYERLKLVRQMANHLAIVDRYQANTQQETW